jgi:hypothetical protein
MNGLLNVSARVTKQKINHAASEENINKEVDKT